MKRIIIPIIPFVVLAACSSGNSKNEQKQTAPAAPQYKLAAVQQGGLAATVKLPAQLAAYQEVSIFPKVNGYVKTVLVDVGSKVQQGQLLMTLDAPELDQAVVQAKEGYVKSLAAFGIDKEKYLRLMEAAQTPGAVSPLDLSAAREAMQGDSAQSNAEKANWQMQQTMTGYLQVTAPFSGVITERNVHPGALVAADVKGTRMLELKQVSHLRLEVDVPEALSAQVKGLDTLTFFVNALTGKKMTAVVVRNADNITQQFRNERIEADIYNDDGQLAPGMYADVLLNLKGGTGAVNVPKSAVVTSTERKYVLVMKDSVVKKVDVTTGNESGTSIEVFGGLQPGDTVIASATDEIAEGPVGKK